MKLKTTYKELEKENLIHKKEIQQKNQRYLKFVDTKNEITQNSE
jgi:hypothetical protein